MSDQVIERAYQLWKPLRAVTCSATWPDTDFAPCGPGETRYRAIVYRGPVKNGRWLSVRQGESRETLAEAEDDLGDGQGHIECWVRGRGWVYHG